MRSLTKIRIALVSIVIALVLSITNMNPKQIPNSESSNLLNDEVENVNLDQIGLKKSGDNEYVKVWDTGDTFSGNMYSFCTGDQDNDGKDEIILGTSNYMYVLEYNSTYNNYTIIFKSRNLGDLLTTITSGDDLDGDNKKEILTCCYNDETMFIFEYNGTDNGYDEVFQKFYGIDHQVDEMWIGNDLDRDIEKEIIVGAGFHVNISEFNGVDDVYDDMWVSVDLGGYVTDVFSNGDLDKDGKKEIIATSTFGIFVFENSGNNSYVGVWNRTLGPNYYSVCIGDDLDEDGKKEIIAGTSGELYIFEHNGTNDDYEEVWNTTTFEGRVVSIAITDDLDGDGKREIIAGSYDKKIYIFEYNGTDNGYSKVWDSGSTFSSQLVSICIGDDFDSNGKKEIIAGSWDSKIYIFEHDDSISSQRPIIIIVDDDDDDDDEEDGIFISNQTLIIGGVISAVVLTGVVIILIKKKLGSER